MLVTTATVALLAWSCHDVQVAFQAQQCCLHPDSPFAPLAPWVKKVAMITHDDGANAFFRTLEAGAVAAAAAYPGLHLEYLYLNKAPEYQGANATDRTVLYASDAVQTADAIVVTATDLQVQGIKDHVLPLGKPTLILNSGEGNVPGAVGYVGQDERGAAVMIAQRAKHDGAENLLCFLHESFNSVHVNRCANAATVLPTENVDAAFLDHFNFLFDASDPAFVGMKAAIDASTADTLLMVGPVGCKYAGQMRKLGVHLRRVVCFDSFPAQHWFDHIRDGEVLATVYQNEWAQGYVSAARMYEYATGLRLREYSAAYTGPHLYDISNVTDLEAIELSQQRQRTYVEVVGGNRKQVSF